MSITPTELRRNLYQLLDEVIETGKPLEVERRGRIIRIAVDGVRGSKLDRLVPHDCIVGDPEELVHMDWSHLWEGEDSLE
jgi:hypothetical protein